MASSGEEFSDDDYDSDYYRGDDDADDNDPTSSDPEQYAYECLDVEAVERLFNENVEAISEEFRIIPSLARVLLHSRQWDLRNVLQEGREDLSNLLIKSRVKPLSGTSEGGAHQIGGFMICPVCLVRNPKECFSSLACRHMFCKDCWSTHFETQVKSGTSTGISCMAQNCGILAPEDVVLPLLSQAALRERYQYLAFCDHVKAHPLLRFCPGAMCNKIVKCTDPKVSRHHAQLDFGEDGAVKLKSTHLNPVYIWKKGADKQKVLLKDDEVDLEDGDAFALLPDKYKYSVCVEGKKDGVEAKEETGEEEAEDFEPVVLLEPLRKELDGKKDDEVEEVDMKPSIREVEEPSKDDVSQPKAADEEQAAEEKNQEEEEQQEPASTKEVSQPKAANEGQTVEEKKEEEEEQQEPASTTSKDDGEEAGGDVRLVQRERHLPSWMQNLGGESSPKKRAPRKRGAGKENTPSPAKKRGRKVTAGTDEEKAEASEEEQPGPSKKTTPAKKRPQKAEPEDDFIVSGSEVEDEEPESPKKRTPKKNRGSDYEDEEPQVSQPMSSDGRPICRFREKCYRKNPDHRSDFCHPGDSDYADDRLECEYGTNCYRKNKDHWLDYKHEHNPNPPRRAKKQANARRRRQLEEEEEDEDEYDMTDPFMADDDEEEEYSPTDDELDEAETELEEDADDSPAEVDEAEEEEQEKKDERRMLKEAKRFLENE